MNKKLKIIISAILILSTILISYVYAVNIPNDIPNYNTRALLNLSNKDFFNMTKYDIQTKKTAIEDLNADDIATGMSLNETDKNTLVDKIEQQKSKAEFWLEQKNNHSGAYDSDGTPFSEKELRDMNRDQIQLANNTMQEAIMEDDNNERKNIKSEYAERIKFWTDDKNNYSNAYSPNGDPYTHKQLQNNKTIEELQEIKNTINNSKSGNTNERKNLKDEMRDKVQYWIDDKNNNKDAYNNGKPYTEEELYRMKTEDVKKVLDAITNSIKDSDGTNQKSAKEERKEAAQYWYDDKTNDKWKKASKDDGTEYSDDELKEMRTSKVMKAFKSAKRALNKHTDNKNEKREEIEKERKNKIKTWLSDKMSDLTRPEEEKKYNTVGEPKPKEDPIDPPPEHPAPKDDQADEPHVDMTPEKIEQSKKDCLTVAEGDDYWTQPIQDYSADMGFSSELYFDNLVSSSALLCRQHGGSLHSKPGPDDIFLDETESAAGSNRAEPNGEQYKDVPAALKNSASTLLSSATASQVIFELLDQLAEYVNELDEAEPENPLEELVTGIVSGGLKYLIKILSQSIASMGFYEESPGTMNADDIGKGLHQDLYSIYTKKEVKTATPAEAYIISDLGNEGGGYPSEQQLAWWGTDGGGNSGGSGRVYQEALAFEEFINSASPSGSYEYNSSGKGFKLKKPHWLEGKISGGINNDSYDNVKVKYDSSSDATGDSGNGKFIIGPYGIDYVRREGFGEIESLKVYTDKYPEGIELKQSGQKVWRVLHCDANGRYSTDVKDADTNYPEPNKPFYIVLDYDESNSSTKVTKIEFTIKYMNAYAQYTQLEGKCMVQKYKINMGELYMDGENVTGKVYFLTKNGTKTEPWQNLTLSSFGMRWWQYYKSSRGVETRSSKIQVIKKLIDSNGNEVEGKTFEFNLNVSGNLIEGIDTSDTISVVSGSKDSSMSKEFFWQGSELPTFTLKEKLDTDKYEIQDIKVVSASNPKEPLEGISISDDKSQVSGKLQEGVVTVIVTNKEKKKWESANLDIKKIIKYDSLLKTDQTELLKGKEFPFLVTIEPGDNSSFYYSEHDDNTHLYEKSKNQKLQLLVTAKAVEEKDTGIENELWKSKKIHWYKGSAQPKYTVQELTTANQIDEAVTATAENMQKYYSKTYSDEEIKQLKENVSRSKFIEAKNETGTLNNDSENHALAIFTNEHEKEKGKIRIVKKLDISALNNLGISDDKKKELLEELSLEFEWKFRVKIGDSEKDYTLDKNYRKPTDDGLGYKWVWESEEKSWLKGDSLTYEIEELLEEGKNIEFVKVDSNDSEATLYQQSKKVAGKFKNKENGEVGVINTFTNKLLTDSTSFNIEKTVGTENDTNERTKALIGKTFEFKVDIKGEFAYDINGDGSYELEFGEHYIRLSNDGYILLNDDGTVKDKQYEGKYIEITPTYENSDDLSTIKDNKWSSGKFYWIKGNAPTYETAEILDKLGMDIISTREKGNKKGKLDEVKSPGSNIIEVSYNNSGTTPVMKKGKIYLRKLVSNLGNISADKIKELKFAFKVKVIIRKKSSEETPTEERDVLPDDILAGSEVRLDIDHLVLEAESTTNDGYIWEWESDEIVWDPEIYENPIFIIEEITSELPEGVEFEDIRTGRDYTIAGDTLMYKGDRYNYIENEKNIVYKNNAKVEGLISEHDMTEDLSRKQIGENLEETEVCFINKIEGKPNEGRIELIKKIENKESLKNKIYGFKIKITEGIFEFNGESYNATSDGPYYLTNDNRLVKGGEFESELVKNLIQIKIEGDDLQNSWLSNMFKWDANDSPPKYEVENVEYEIKLEDNTVNTIDNFDISPKKGSLSNSGNLVQVTAINTEYEEKYTQLKIIKKLENKDPFTGLPVFSDEELKQKKFEFKITLSGGRGTKNVVATYNRTEGDTYIWEYTSDVYKFQKEEDKIDYEITELQTNEGIEFDYWLEGSEKNPERTIKGTLKGNEETTPEVTVVCVNKITSTPEEDQIELTKIIKGSNLSELKNKIYGFKIKITGGIFEFNGKIYNLSSGGDLYLTNDNRLVPATEMNSNEKLAKNLVQIEIKDGESNTWISNKFKWYKNNPAPKYEIVEEYKFNGNGIPEEYKKVEISPKSGTLGTTNNKTKITAINTEYEEKYTRLKIIKKFKNIDPETGEKLYTEEYLKSLTFEFKITLSGGRGTKNVVATYNRTEGDTYIWEYTSDVYKFQEGETQIDYEITELQTNEGIEFDYWEGLEENHERTITGTLKGNGGTTPEVTVVCWNKAKITSEPEEGSIELIKEIEDKENLKNKIYGFKIKITEGKFEYNGKKYELKANDSSDDLYLTNDARLVKQEELKEMDVIQIKIGKELKNVWNSNIFKWDKKNSAPKYEILNEEYIVDIDNQTTERITNDKKFDISPKTGSLGATNNKTIITASNKDFQDKKTKLKIIKKLKNIDPETGMKLYTDEYLKSLTFEFNITLSGGRGTKNVVATYNRTDGDTYIWEYESDEFKFKEDEERIDYTIVEVKKYDNMQFLYWEKLGDKIFDNLIEGTLSGNNTGDIELEIVCWNQITADNDEGKLQIEKVVDAESLKDKVFKFDVTVSGTFEYTTKYKSLKQEPEKEETKQVINSSVTFENVEVKGGQLITVATFKWSELHDNPTYVVTEKESEIEERNGKKVAEIGEIENSSGTIKSSREGTQDTVIVRPENETTYTHGYIKVTKKAIDPENNEELGTELDANKEHEFIVKVYKDRTNSEIIQKFSGSIKAGEIWTSPKIEWETGAENPTYTVEEVGEEAVAIEVKEDGETLDFKKNINKRAKVQIAESPEEIDGTKIVIIKNNIKLVKGKFKIIKRVRYEKTGTPDAEFKISYRITGNFIYDKGGSQQDYVYNDKKEGKITLKDGEEWTSEFITFNPDNPPTVYVEETNIDELNSDLAGDNWKNENVSNNNTSLLLPGDTDEVRTLEIVVDNSYTDIPIQEFFIELGGNVWEDKALNPNDKNSPDSVPNGKMDSGETELKGVKVYVYDSGTDQVANLNNKFGGIVEQPIITDEDGRWDAAINLPTLEEDMFYVEFIYDGQTYEPTKYLVTGEGNASNYKNAPTNSKSGTLGRDSYQNDSMALDYNRDEVNNRLARIKGKTAMDGSGETTGIAVGKNGEENEIYYTSDANDANRKDVTGIYNRVKSTLKTTENSKILELYEAKARTFVEGTSAQLKYPFDDKSQLSSVDSTTKKGAEIYIYKAVGKYLKHINLGLVEREKADISAIKDAVEAKVIVKDRLLVRNFNKLADKGKDYLDVELNLDRLNGLFTSNEVNSISYELGLYKTEYYYRAEMYKGGKNYSSIENFYKNLNDIGTSYSLDDTEMEVFITYKITLLNESPSYKVKIRNIEDYSDTTMELVREDIKRYIQKDDGSEGEMKTIVTVSDSDYVTNLGEYKEQEEIKGSDNVLYKKSKITFNGGDEAGIVLGSGERKEILLTYKMKKEAKQGIEESVILGNKSNIVEIGNYSTYYENDKIAGRIDMDSAPNNINIQEYNVKERYEDDTYSAPKVQLKLISETNEVANTVEGNAWEDGNGNGLYDSDEALIGGLTTQLVEKILVPDETDSNKYQEYDFIWPTNERLSALGGRSFKELTGFDSTTETSRKSGTVGKYTFKGIPSGNYVVRFSYGIDKGTLDDTEGITGDPVALKSDGTYYSKEKNGGEVLTANYDEDRTGKTPAVYNGQDYKTTIYQAGTTEEGKYLTNELHKLDATNANIDSDARDSEVRRLEIMANSLTINNNKADELMQANDLDGNHGKLYDNYSMFADTAKLVFSAQDENNPKEILNLDIGLEERPETNIVLDKQINEIKITTNDNKVIFDGLYNINYEVKNKNEASQRSVIAKIEDNKYICANVQLDPNNSTGIEVLQALNKAENKLTDMKEANQGTQNFRYINIDDTILQGSTIEINYTITALNVGEVDTISKEIADLSKVRNVEEILAKAKSLQEENVTFTKSQAEGTTDKTYEIGKYIGTQQYTGKRYTNTDSSKSDQIVTTRIRQLIDYVDNDAVFATNKNATNNAYWKNGTIMEINGNGETKERLVSGSVTRDNSVVDKNDREYVTETRNNIALSVDEGEETVGLNNAGFEKELIPYAEVIKTETDAQKIEEGYTSKINLCVTKVVASEDDAENMSYDNLAEILRYENTVGRRDVTITPGNTKPKLGEYRVSLYERDVSATELVTFTPPTGIESEITLKIQILIVTLSSLVIITIGVLIIKKKVLTKKNYK